MAGFMDMFGGGDGGNSGNSGMFGGMFGGGDMYGDLLTDEQKQRMQQQTMMTMAAKLLQAGGPSTTPTNLGQALGGAFLSGQEAYGKSGQNAVQGMLTKQKIEEYRSEKKRKEALNAMISGGMQGPAPTQMQTPDPSNITLGAMPQSSATAMQPGMPGMQPGMQGMQTGMPGMQTGMPGMQTGMQGQTSNGMFGLNPQQAKLFPLLPATDQEKMLVDAAGQRVTFGNPVTEMGPGGNPVQVVYGSDGSRRVVPGATPFNKPTSGIQEYEYAKLQGYSGTLEQFQNARAKSGASSTNFVTPPGQTAGRAAVDTKYAEDYLQWTQGGGADAIGNLAQIGTVLQQLEQGRELTGPMIGIQPDFILALTNPNAADAKQRVEEVVQRNLRVVLGPAFTAKEGESLIARAYNPTLSSQQNAARLRRLYQQMQIASNSRQEMARYFEEKGTLTGYKGPRVNINQFYAALEVKTPPKAGDTVEFNGRALKFKGGDPNQESNWEEN